MPDERSEQIEALLQPPTQPLSAKPIMFPNQFPETLDQYFGIGNWRGGVGVLLASILIS